MTSLFSKDLLADTVVDSELFFRPLQSDDYERGFCELLGQLTVSELTKSKFDERFKEMEKAVVCEDKKTNKLAAAGTIFVEKKFLRRGGLCGHIEDIVVDSTYRGKNLGLRLIEQLKNVGMKVGCYKIILDCSEKNVPFYEKCNFNKKEVQMAMYTNASKLGIEKIEEIEEIEKIDKSCETLDAVRKVMRRGLAGAYDAAINSLKKQPSLDYRAAVKLFNSNPPLSPLQADELLSTTQTALCDNEEVYKAYLSYHANNGSPDTVVKKFNEYKDKALRNSTSSDLHAIVVHALHDIGDVAGMANVAAELRVRGRLAMTTAETESLLLHLAHTDPAQCESWWLHLRGTKLNLQPSTYDALVATLARAQSTVALQVLGHMDTLGISPHEETYAALLQMVDSSTNSRTFDRVLSKTHTRDACSALLMQCVRTGNLARAQELRFLRGTSAFSVASLNLLLAAYAKQGNVTRGTALLKDMLERDAVTFEIAANMYARAGDARACRELVSEMNASSVPITRDVLLALMDVCVTHGDAKVCEGIFEKLRSANEETCALYDKMLTLYGNAGDLQKARDTWELMINQGVMPSTNSYNLIIAAHAKQGKSADCLRLFHAMKASKVAPNLATFAGIVTAHVQRRNFRSSRKFFEEMTQAMPVKDALGAIFEYCSLKSSLKNQGLQSTPQ